MQVTVFFLMANALFHVLTPRITVTADFKQDILVYTVIFRYYDLTQAHATRTLI